MRHRYPGLYALVLGGLVAIAAGVVLDRGGRRDEELARVVAMLQEEEGFRAHPYRDAGGVLTVGYGTNLDVGITREEGAYLLKERLRTEVAALAGTWPAYYDAPERARAALADMAYQLGGRGVLGFDELLGHVERREWDEAAAAALASVWASETPARAERVARVFRALGGNP